MNSPIHSQSEHEGQVERIILDQPKGNVIDRAMVAALRERIAVIAAAPGRRKLIVFTGAGKHFSFGASVEDHRRETAGEFLHAFSQFFLELEALSIPTAAVVRGQCLGGALELAAACGTVFCAPEARLGVPEIQLAVFPPVAAILLPWRLSGTRATALILSGEAVTGEEAARMGLADHCAEDPEAALQAWFTKTLAPKSAFALRHAWRAVRRPLAAALAEALPVFERQYLDELMAGHDANEGIAAFLEKRAPRWEDC